MDNNVFHNADEILLPRASKHYKNIVNSKAVPIERNEYGLIHLRKDLKKDMEEMVKKIVR